MFIESRSIQFKEQSQNSHHDFHCYANGVAK